MLSTFYQEGQSWHIYWLMMKRNLITEYLLSRTLSMFWTRTNTIWTLHFMCWIRLHEAPNLNCLWDSPCATDNTTYKHYKQNALPIEETSWNDNTEEDIVLVAKLYSSWKLFRLNIAYCYYVVQKRLLLQVWSTERSCKYYFYFIHWNKHCMHHCLPNANMK